MFKKAVILMLSVLFLVNMSGCVALLAGAAGGAGTQAWLSGKLVQDVNTPFENTIYAAKTALESLNLGIVKEIKKTDVAQIKSNYTDGETIWIDIHRISQSTSRIAVRVGAMPDQEAAVEILNKIKEYLSE